MADTLDSGSTSALSAPSHETIPVGEFTETPAPTVPPVEPVSLPNVTATPQEPKPDAKPATAADDAFADAVAQLIRSHANGDPGAAVRVLEAVTARLSKPER